jgi:hypothetical protein
VLCVEKGERVYIVRFLGCVLKVKNVSSEGENVSSEGYSSTRTKDSRISKVKVSQASATLLSALGENVAVIVEQEVI